MENQKKLADVFLSINQLNRQKWYTLTEMKKLELTNRSDSNQYIEWIQIFEMICSVQKKNLLKLSGEDKEKIQELITEFNPNINDMDFFEILKLENRSLILNRTLTDIGNPRLYLYNGVDNSFNPIIELLYQIIGLNNQEESEETVNEELVNQYMVSDLMNILYQVIQDLLKEDSEIEENEELLCLKYKLIFLSEAVETRALITKFSIPDYPNLTTNTEIEDTGLTIEEYNDSLDTSILNYIGKIVDKLNESLYTGKKEIDCLNIVILKALISLLKNKEICKGLIINYDEELPDYIKEQIEIISQILEEAQHSQKDYQKQRRYSTI